MIVVPLLLRLHRWSLFLYPAAFRAEFGEEMETVFDAALTEAGQKNPRAIALVCLQELADFPVSLSQAYAHSWGTMRPQPVQAPGLPWLPAWALLTTLAIPIAWLLSGPLGAALLLAFDLIALGWYVELEPNDPQRGFAAGSPALAYLKENAGMQRVEIATSAWQPNLPQLEKGGVHGAPGANAHAMGTTKLGKRVLSRTREAQDSVVEFGRRLELHPL